MRSYHLFGFISALTAAALVIGCTTKFKESEDGDADVGPDTQTDGDPAEATDPLPDGEDGQDLPADGEDGDGEPLRTIEFTSGPPQTRTLTHSLPISCGIANNYLSNMRALLSSGNLYVFTTYPVQPATADEVDCASALAYSLPAVTQTDDQDICGDPMTNIYADGWLNPSVFEDDAHLYVFEVVDDHSGGEPGRGNVRGYRFRKDGLNDDGMGYVFSDPWSEGPRPPFSGIAAKLCGDKAHFFVKGEEDAPGVPTDYYGFTLDNSSSSEFDTMFDSDTVRDFAEAGHFIDATYPSPETARAIFLTDLACRDVFPLLSGQEFHPDGSVTALVVNFETELIRNDNHDWSEVFICTSDDCEPANEPVTEGLTMIHVDRPAALDMLFAAWVTNEEPFGSLDPPPSRLHAGALVTGNRVMSSFTSDPMTVPGESDVALQIYPPTFECSAFKAHYNRLFYDSVRQVLLITMLLYDYRPDAGRAETKVGVWALDAERRALAPPFFLTIDLPIMLGYEAVLDEDSGTLYFVWLNYNLSAVNVSEGTIEADVNEVVIAPVTYREGE